MSIIDTLITDRTTADLQAVKSLNSVDMSTWSIQDVTQYLSGMKGAYNANDLNRVGQACAYLYGEFTRLGYDVTGYTPLRTNWTIYDIPTAQSMIVYITTVNALKAIWNAVQEIPSTMERLTVNGANNIERLLIEIDELKQLLETGFIYSVEVESGEV